MWPGPFLGSFDFKRMRICAVADPLRVGIGIGVGAAECGFVGGGPIGPSVYWAVNREHVPRSRWRRRCSERTCRSVAASRRGSDRSDPSRSHMFRSRQTRLPLGLSKLSVGAGPDQRCASRLQSNFRRSDRRHDGPGGRDHGEEGEGDKPRRGRSASRRVARNRRPASWESKRAEVGTSPSSAAPARSLSPGRRGSRDGLQWAIQDSNLGPPPYQRGALTN